MDASALLGEEEFALNMVPKLHRERYVVMRDVTSTLRREEFVLDMGQRLKLGTKKDAPTKL